LPAFTVDADLGPCLIENTCLSCFHSLPNKRFEYLLCGVPVLASDFPEMRAVVTAHRCGWTVEPDAGRRRESLRRIDAPAIDAARTGAMVARAAFDWEAEADVMRRLYDDLGFTARNEPEARVPGR
jgi:glycosyltransferase involved in cell wall biosynthesis